MGDANYVATAKDAIRARATEIRDACEGRHIIFAEVPFGDNTVTISREREGLQHRGLGLTIEFWPHETRTVDDVLRIIDAWDYTMPNAAEAVT
jgi:hypothetical protein